MENQTKKILVVEDEVPMSRALKLKLEKSGFLVATALDGLEAIKCMDTDNFDLILLDIIMPNLDGFGVLEQMKAKKIETPVVVLSNLGQGEDVQRAKSLGATGYVIKSNISISDLVKQIKKALNV